jgi:hypothetical protein
MLNPNDPTVMYPRRQDGAAKGGIHAFAPTEHHEPRLPPEGGGVR